MTILEEIVNKDIANGELTIIDYCWIFDKPWEYWGA